jgi:GTPase SAR1 family protein
MCFSVENPTSYSNIKSKWAPEIKHHCPNVPIILVGTKLDLRTNQKRISELAKSNQKPMSTQDGHQLANDIHAAGYMECSARENINIREVFNEAIRIHLHPPQKKPTSQDGGKKGPCSLL